jgi:aldehyde dehydrogenase (NAD+)
VQRPNLKLLIDGKLVDSVSDQTYESVNPATGEFIATVAWGGTEDAHRAIAAARSAFDAGPWREFSPAERRAALEKLAAALDSRSEDFVLNEVRDAGALIAKARTDVGLGVAHLRQFARMAEKYDGQPKPIDGLQKAGRSFSYIVREPIGVCGSIIPWNFPLTMALWKIGPALATGNTLVLKCAPETPVSALELGGLIKDAGIPDGVVNIITGDVDAGEALTRSPLVDKISFTGSTEVGRAVMAAASSTLKRVTLECGGKSANVVLDDANPTLAIDGSLYASFFHSGQVCESGTRLLLNKSQHDAFVEKLVDRARHLKVGDPLDSETNIGPVVSQKQLDRVLGYIHAGKAAGAVLRLGGNRRTDGDLSRGFFVEPTIFTGVGNSMTIAREEIFGPVLSILSYENDDEAVRIANDTIYGLAAGVWSTDDARALSIAARLRAGYVWVNEWHVLNMGAPFGGFKQSGIGREFGAEGLNAYTEVKTIYQDDVRNRSAKSWYNIVVPN